MLETHPQNISKGWLKKPAAATFPQMTSFIIQWTLKTVLEEWANLATEGLAGMDLSKCGATPNQSSQNGS